ncbi:hypothetical protein scyTo_0020250 [Scyliorhinus torazame]|uniref:Ig-like domain-containing protein n=1 Tax=Scyliorhinus torazame TaxID=75743 RepID=A0A401Q385_SCYTO|nr:hypothetical protein [Scyliorhinus torazame]
MHWVRQVPGQGLEWLLNHYGSSSSSAAPGIENRFTSSLDASNNIFSADVKNLETEDTAIYYCASTAVGLDGNTLGHWGQGTMVTVTVAKPSVPSLYALLSCQQHNTDGPLTYGCLAMGYSPEITSLTWKKDQETITTGLRTYPSVLNKKRTHTLSSQLTITESEVGSSKIYCEVQRDGTVWKKEMPG